MKDEYDFSRGTRGKFFRSGTQMNLPIYLDEEVMRYLRALAQAKGVELSQLVNDLLRRDIELAEAMR
jgi:hypothetical protein